MAPADPAAVAQLVALGFPEDRVFFSKKNRFVGFVFFLVNICCLHCLFFFFNNKHGFGRECTCRVLELGLLGFFPISFQ